MTNIAVFASGSGTNAENLARYFEKHPKGRVVVMISDRKDAFVFERMRKLQIPSYYMSREDFENGSVLKLLDDNKVSIIVLAGFLRLIPESLINQFRGKIINIHPALLPAFGGKGMYGKRVHEAVLLSGTLKTGITVHYVNKNFDEGEIIAQYETPISKDDTVESIERKIHELEMKWFPVIIEGLL